jgi:Glycosyltransferase family 87
MWRALRENATCALFAALGCALCGWLALYGMGWNDYEVEVQPAYEALSHGHPLLFLQLAPVYGGSLIERAPFAMAPRLWDGGALAVYRAAAVPCLLAAAALGVWLVAGMRRRGSTALARAVALGTCVVNPITLTALETGHPEELFGGVLCVTAALLACAPTVSRRRAAAAGLLLGLAIANKQWALVALGPVLVALPANRRRTFVAVAAATAAALLAPLLAASATHFTDGAQAAASPGSTIFQPWQLWWFFGHHGSAVHDQFGALKPGYRTGPGWAGAISHPAVLLAGVAIGAALLWRSRGARLAPRGVLAALALVLLLRCMLDTWDTGYYTLPFLLALLAWELQGSAQAPLGALAASVIVWLNFQWLAAHAGADVQAAAFLAWSLPLAAWLGLRTAAQARPVGTPGRSAQEMTVRSLGRLVSTSGAPERTTTRSSIRTPSVSGR